MKTKICSICTYPLRESIGYLTCENCGKVIYTTKPKDKKVKKIVN